MKDYHINIFYSVEDEAYIADIPDLKYVSAIAKTPRLALNEVILAKTAWLEAANTENKTIPIHLYTALQTKAGDAKRRLLLFGGF